MCACGCDRILFLSVPSDDEEVTTAEFSVNLADRHTWSINFYECASEGDLECLEEILDSGHVAVNDVDVDGFTALMVAAAEGHADVVRALLRRGAEVSMRTYELRSSALHFAAKVQREKRGSCIVASERERGSCLIASERERERWVRRCCDTEADVVVVAAAADLEW